MLDSLREEALTGMGELARSFRIGKQKDDRTHLACKAEHAIDLETELIVAAEVCHGDHSDSQTAADTAKVRKRLLSTTAAHNLGLLMRKLLGAGKPRALHGPPRQTLRPNRHRS